MTGGKVDAATALGLGLVHAVVEPAQLEATVEATVRQLLRGAPEATRATKALFHRLHPGVTDEAIAHAAHVFAAAARSPEAMEGMQAFLTKQKPSWSR